MQFLDDHTVFHSFATACRISLHCLGTGVPWRLGVEVLLALAVKKLGIRVIYNGMWEGLPVRSLSRFSCLYDTSIRLWDTESKC
jgi:hypothetical protein